MVGALNEIPVAPGGFVVPVFKDYSRPLEFYSPNYGESKLFPPDDHRRTLYWNPDVETDEHGNVELKCYNAGNSTT